MKKPTLLCFLMLTICWVNAQVINQSAGWPNPAWTITGSYATGATAFESDPTTTSSFAFDDDDAASAHEDNIAAESPVINLTAAFTAGETWLTVTVQYGYRYLDNDRLRFEYWNAATSTWVAWGTNIPGNSTTATDNYCTTITKTSYTTSTLSIAAFTPTQLTGFKYRISYDDDPAGADYNYGFCFDSPTIVSSTPPSCPAPTLASATATSNSAILSWTENGSATLYNVEYGPNGFTQGTGTLLNGVTNSYNLSPLTSSTAYSYYVQAACSVSSTSTWVGPTNFTTLFTPPANDECINAPGLTVNSDYSCGTVTAGTTQGATLSMAAAPCFGNPDDDVWYRFTATATSHRISLTNIVAVGAGTSTDAYIQVLSGTCGQLTSFACSDPETSNLTGLTVGQTYYVRVYTYYATNGITFNICVGTPPPPPPAPANDECSGAVGLTVNSDYACGTITAGSTNGATLSMAATPCFGNPDDDVWYRFTATSTSHRISLTNIVAAGGSGTSTDAYIQVLSGVCGQLTSFACSDPETSNLTGLTVGETYYVRVYTYSATNGITFNICVGTPPPAPANDNLANAIAISCGNNYTGDTTFATLDENSAPDGFGADMDAPNVWYSFTGNGTPQTVTLNLCGSSYDTSVLIYTGVSGQLTLVGGNDDDASCNATNDSSRSRVNFTSNGTTTYFIAVEGWNVGNVGAFTMDITCAAVNPPAVANQTCGTALAVSVDGTDTNSDNSFGTINGTQPSCDTFGSIQDVWFSFVAPASGEVNALFTRNTMTSLNYTFYSGACGSLTNVGTCTTNVTGATSAQTYTGLTPGNTYFVQVWSSGAEQGTFALRLTENLGNNDFDSSAFSHYPNPVKSTLNFSYNQEISNVEVFNLLGQKVISNKVNATSGQIDMSDLAKGAYIVKVTSNNQVKTIKVVKE